MEITSNDELAGNLGKMHGDQCRICLKQTVQICELFRNGNAIPKKLMAVASVKVEEGDGLPPVICVRCNQLLDTSYNFKHQIQSSDQKLRQILKLQSSKENGVTSTSIVKAIIADVISSVISSQKSNFQEQTTYQSNPDISRPDASSFMKEEEKFCLDTTTGTITYYTKEIDVLNKYARKLDDGSDDIGHSLSDNSCKRELCESSEANIVKQEELCLGNGNDISQGEACLQKEHFNVTLENDTHLREDRDLQGEALRLGNTQKEVKGIDDEEKPLISRTSRLRCTQCIKSFRTKRAMQRHVIMHNHKTKLRYVCYVCEKQYSNVTKLKNHVKICHDSKDKKGSKDNAQDKKVSKKVQKNYDTSSKEGKRNFKFVCKVCSKQFTYQKSFLTHAKAHPEYASELLSSDCYQEKEKSENLSEEEQNEEEEEGEAEEDEEEDERELPAESLQCTQCGKLFATKRNLKRHVSTHSGLKYNCTTCGKGFSRVDKLKDHEQSKHKMEMFESSDTEGKDDVDNVNKSGDFTENRKKERHNRPHKCSVCPKSFAQAQSLENHMERHKRVKETQKRFLCEVCSKCFAQSGSLVAHMRTHTGVKPYVCTVCSRAFTKSTYLQLHMRTHSGEKPYICQYCSRAFARANTLARHITMHTGEAKYHCQICTKSFRRLTSLNEHTYTHTGQRPYACQICTKRYNNAGSLYAHRKKCKAQQLAGTGFAVSVENSVQQMDGNMPQVLIYSQRKLVDDATVSQMTQAPQYMIANVQSQKNLGSNIIQPFTVDDPNVYAINSKQFKNPYYTIYPNM